MDYILGHKSNLNKFKKIEIISSIFEHNAMTLDINHREKNKQTSENKLKLKKHKLMELKQYITK